IRDRTVTGVQTCALPIFLRRHLTDVLDLSADGVEVRELLPYDERAAAVLDGSRRAGRRWRRRPLMRALRQLAADLPTAELVDNEIGRASCRERVASAVGV